MSENNSFSNNCCIFVVAKLININELKRNCYVCKISEFFRAVQIFQALKAGWMPICFHFSVVLALDTFGPRLSLEKHDGISAVQLILSLCLFRVNGESVHSIYKKNFYDLLDTGKNCYYRMLTRPSMDWRKLLNHMLLRFICILRREGVWAESENSCLILDDTTLEKTGYSMERVSRVFDHVQGKCVPMTWSLRSKSIKNLFF